MNEAAALFQKSPRTIRGWITEGLHGIVLEAVWLGDGWRIEEAAIRRFLRRLKEMKNKNLNRR